MSGSQVREELEALAALLGTSQAVTDCSGASAPPSPGAADRLPRDFRASKPIPTPARCDGRRPRDTTHPDYWKHCEDVITGARRFETRNAWITSDDAGDIAPSSFRHHLRAVYPPHLPRDPSWMNQAELEYGRPSSNGIDVQPAVDQNRRRVRDYLGYAGKEQDSRQNLFDKLDELEEKLVRVRQDTLDLGPNRRKERVPQPVLDKISALQRKESELNKGHPKLLNLLWNRRAEVQRTLTRLWEKKPLNLEMEDETRDRFIADPSCAPKAPAPDTNGAQSPPKEKRRRGRGVPDWFRVLENTGCVALGSEGEENRFVELLNKMWRLEEEVRREEYQRKHGEQAGGQGTPKAPWDHHFHEPNPGWAHEKQRRRGGWWTCRDDEDAPLAERLCQICRWESPESSTCGSPSRQAVYGRTQKTPPPAKARPQQQRKPRQCHNPKVSAADYLEELMGHVHAAMAVVAEKDKRSVIATMQMERLDANRRLQGDERGGFPPPSE